MTMKVEKVSIFSTYFDVNMTGELRVATVPATVTIQMKR